MTKREFCETHDTIAYYSGFGGLEIKGFDCDAADDYMYCVSGRCKQHDWRHYEQRRQYRQ